MNLYKISKRYEQALIEFEDTELPDDVVADTLEALEGELVDKGKNVAAFIKNMEADVNAIKEAAKAMRERATAMERRTNHLKMLLLNTMQKHEIHEISCPWFVIKPRKHTLLASMSTNSYSNIILTVDVLVERVVRITILLRSKSFRFI